MAEWNYIVSVQVAAIVSVCCSASVILTAVLFPKMREKLLVQIVCYISIADLVGNALYIPTTRPSNGSFLCALEGFMHLYSYPVSWLWSTALLYFLFNLALNGKKFPPHIPTLHCICWGVPLVFTLLNLTTNTYGRTDDYPDYEVCVIAGDYKSGLLWHAITYDCLWLFCTVFMGYMYFRIHYLCNHGLAISMQEFKKATSTLGKYPIALLVFWFPHMLSVLLLHEVLWRYGIIDFYVASLVVKILHGVATTLIFFYNSTEARYLWYDLFIRIIQTIYPWYQTDDFRPRESFDLSRYEDQAFSLTYDVDEDTGDEVNTISNNEVVSPIAEVVVNV